MKEEYYNTLFWGGKLWDKTQIKKEGSLNVIVL